MGRPENERQHTAQNFVSRISKSAYNEPILRAMSASQKLKIT